MTQISQKIIIKLRDTDAAGLLFFANQLVYAHDLYELFLERIGFPLPQVIRQEPFLLPIVHVESDYLAKLEVGEQVEIILTVAKISDSSFTLAYQLFNSAGELAGEAKTVHVAVDKKRGQKIKLPDKLRNALTLFRDAP
ncbi:MAG: acyl-CoA thioesterase [candidate division Zixibacteria bacterium]|nr:acyl-CoA thioesterase [candidate division Zixibacteria bacterium]